MRCLRYTEASGPSPSSYVIVPYIEQTKQHQLHQHQLLLAGNHRNQSNQVIPGNAKKVKPFASTLRPRHQLRGPPHPRMAGHQAQGLERRSVVSSFIFHLPHAQSEKPRVALFKRSAKVSTYKYVYPAHGLLVRTTTYVLCRKTETLITAPQDTTSRPSLEVSVGKTRTRSRRHGVSCPRKPGSARLR